MRRLFTTAEARRAGVSDMALRWGARSGRWRRAARGVYADGPEPVLRLDRARAAVMASASVARGRLAAVLLDLDGVVLGGPHTFRRAVPADAVVTIDGVPCTDGLQTLIDLAAVLDDDTWEQALECVLRQKLATIADIDRRLPELARSRTPGTQRIRRVLACRGRSAVPTGSLLETLMVQLARRVAGLPSPKRQVLVVNRHGDFVAYVDLAWPDLGVFIELDGQQHEHQPVYDARRETAVVAATGWLCGRFTWDEVFGFPVSTARRLAEVIEQARFRPLRTA
jgi:very-short-patch-repair endonuclease